MTTSTRVNVASAMDNRDQVNRRLVRCLAEGGRWDIAEAIFGEETPQLACGSSPRLKAVK